MLKLTNIKPTYFTEDIDEAFEGLAVDTNYDIVKTCAEMNGCIMITPSNEVDTITKIVDLRMRHPLFGSISLNKLPSGYKALCMATICKKNNKPFCCYEFVFGANVLKLLFNLAEDTDLLSIFSNTLTISEVTSDIYDCRLIIDNNGTEFARKVMVWLI